MFGWLKRRWLCRGTPTQAVSDLPISASPAEPSEPSNHVLKRRVDELERRVASLQGQLDHPGRFDLRPLKDKIKPGLLVAAATLLAVVPSLLVVQDRWLREHAISGSLDDWWRKIDFLRRLGLPSYFLLIFPCFLGSLALVWCSKEVPLSVFSNLGLGTASPATAGISPAQSRASRIVFIASAIALAIIILSAPILHRVPGWDLALALLAYLLAWVLREIPVKEIIKRWRQKRDLILAVLLAHLAFIEFLASCSRGNPLWIFSLLLALAALNLLRHRREVSPVLLVMSLALILYTLNINAWWFSIIGDEYSFFDYARDIAGRQSPSFIGSHLFNGQAVYGTHPYLSSFIQAIFMKVLGSDNFGWRFSGIYLGAIAIGFFFLFFKTFVPRRIALIASLLLASSHYLMTFGKIGYDNLQAFFAMSLALWATAWALRSMRLLAFVVLGLALGFCFYVYPAALYVVPLPLLLLLLYAPPTSKPAIRRWVIVALSMFLLIFPLLLQPGYWEAKRAGTFLDDPEVMRSIASLLQSVATRLLYAFVSFVYVVHESHFVAVSYVDPLSAALLVLGMAHLLKQIRKRRFALFLMLGFAMLLLLVGASSGVAYPPTTRMFLLLPWFALFAAVGLTWMQRQITNLLGNQTSMATFSGLAMIAVIGLNLYQAYPLSRQRMEQYQNLAMLYLRTAMRAQELEGDSPKTFVFITDPAWGIDGIKGTLQQVYSVPTSPLQVIQVTVTDTNLPEAARTTIADPSSLVIIKPWLDAQWKSTLEVALQELGKVPCDIKTTGGAVRFQLWHSGGADTLCQ